MSSVLSMAERGPLRIGVGGPANSTDGGGFYDYNGTYDAYNL